MIAIKGSLIGVLKSLKTVGGALMSLIKGPCDDASLVPRVTQVQT